MERKLERFNQNKPNKHWIENVALVARWINSGLVYWLNPAFLLSSFIQTAAQFPSILQILVQFWFICANLNQNQKFAESEMAADWTKTAEVLLINDNKAKLTIKRKKTSANKRRRKINWNSERKLMNWSWFQTKQEKIEPPANERRSIKAWIEWRQNEFWIN